MHIEIEVPEDMARHLEAKWGSLSHRAAETLAVEAYREGLLTEAQVQQMLNLSSRWSVEALLRRSRVYLNYTDADLDHDLSVLDQISAK